MILENVRMYEAFRTGAGTSKCCHLPINAIAIDTETKKDRTESAQKLRQLFKKANVTMISRRKAALVWVPPQHPLTIAEKDGKAILTLSECYRLGDSLDMDKSVDQESNSVFPRY